MNLVWGFFTQIDRKTKNTAFVYPVIRQVEHSFGLRAHRLGGSTHFLCLVYRKIEDVSWVDSPSTQHRTGHVYIHTAKRMWSHVVHNTSQCGLRDGISVCWLCSHLYLELSTCDLITRDRYPARCDQGQ